MFASVRECLTDKTFFAKYLRNILFSYLVMFVLPSLYPQYIYPHYPHIIMSTFQRENPKKYTWELEIVISTIIYTFPCGFPLLLPFHIQILKRLIVQTLTTPNLSVKWGFCVAGKYWKEPIIGRCNRAELSKFLRGW